MKKAIRILLCLSIVMAQLNVFISVGAIENKKADVLGNAVFSFDKEEDLQLFGERIQTKMLTIRDGKLVISTQGYKSSILAGPSVTSSIIDKEIAYFPYMVIRAKIVGGSNNMMRVYFREKNGDFTEQKAVSQYLSTEYEDFIFDLTEQPFANNTLEQFKIVFGYTETGEVLIDSVTFTDTLADIDYVDPSEPFPIIRTTYGSAFADVKKTDWFYNDVLLAYRRGIINGKSNYTFVPDDNVTIAEAITIAVKMYRIYHKMDELVDVSDDVWYEAYVQDAIQHGIIRANDYSDYTADATRRDAAVIFYRAFPSDYYNAQLNVFESVSDMRRDDSAYSIVLRMFKAGILTGVGEEYNFLPEAYIKRSEVAAIVARMIVKDNRVHVVTAAEEALYIDHYTAEKLKGKITFQGCEPEVLENGMLCSNSIDTDPKVVLTSLFAGKDGSEIEEIRIGFLFGNSVANPINGGCRIYYTTPDGGWAEQRSVAPSWNGKKDDNGVAVFVFDTSDLAGFQTTLREVRFDPFNAYGNFAIQYIDIKYKQVQ